jgi:hypothetical protein
MTKSAVVHLTQAELNRAIGTLIADKLAATGIEASTDTASRSYFMVMVDPPVVPGAEIVSQADRDGDGIRLTYLLDQRPSVTAQRHGAHIEAGR